MRSRIYKLVRRCFCLIGVHDWARGGENMLYCKLCGHVKWWRWNG